MTELEEVNKSNTKRNFLIFFISVISIGIILWFILGNFAQVMAGTIFMATVLGTLMFWRFRLAIAFAGIGLLLATQTIDIEHTINFMSIDVITFLASMMIIVEIAKRGGLFKWLLYRLLVIVKYDPIKVIIVLLTISTLMAAMVDEVTSIIFITAIVFEYCRYFNIDPVPFVISTVLATNIGSSATMLGNPIGILIGLRAKLTFEDFIIYATPVAILSLIVIIFLCTFWYRKMLKKAKAKIMKLNNTNLIKEEFNIREVKLSGILLFVTIFMIAMHYRIELIFNLEKSTFLLIAAYIGASIGLIWKREEARSIVEKGVDWWTLIFFMFLFAKAGALKYTGLTDVLASGIASIASSQHQIQSFMLWFSGFASSVLDNVVLIAALIPVVQSIGNLGFSMAPLWWALLFGGTYGGNITMIGSTANIVALGMLEKECNYYMKFFKWLPIGLLGGVLPMLVAQIWLIMIFH
ncbi:MAG: SLC13 family permease [Candidatus Methanomethylicia archaeon]|nr:SLC13 family permease [Candidatus Methanomethylicia archaeon]